MPGLDIAGQALPAEETSGDLYVWYMNRLVATTAGYLTPNRPSTPDWQVAPR